ncbi:MAG: hypothetical protein Q8K50_12640 [Hydrogenophaga sp.]|nr:hypothetical protein [Hydrogenophaga sp.]
MPTTQTARNSTDKGPSMKTYLYPARNGSRQVTFKELQTEADLMLAHVAKEPFEADQAAQNFSDALFRLMHPQSEKNAANAAQLIGWAVLLSMAFEDAQK